MTGERGAATVWSLALASLLLTVGVIVASAGALAAARQRAATVADIAALAGAQALGDRCMAASAMVTANGMATVSCVLDGTDVVIEASAPPPAIVQRLLLLLGQAAVDVRASARAGPP